MDRRLICQRGGFGMIPKYRVWHHELGRLMSVKCMFFQDSEIEEFELNDALMNDYITAYPDEIELMQSTGLKDKNGKEIFEGDVLELKDCGETIGNVKVYWDDSLALFQLDAIIVDEKAPIYKVVDDENYSYIVVGNIYENSELLEDKK